MPKGTFEADFTEFDRVVEQSTAKLRGLEDEAAKIGPVVDQIGGAAPSAFGELITGADRAGTAMKGLGADTETAEQWLARSLSGTTNLGTSLTQMAPAATTARGGLNAVAEGAGLTAAGLGAAGSASLVVGTAIAAWDFGRAVAGWFDLDTAIGNTTAKLLGWGDVAAETAAAKADVLAKASAAVGSTITDLGTAMAINENTLKGWQENLDTSAHRVAIWRDEIAKVRSQGNLDRLTQDLASHNFSLKELSERYHLTVEAIQFFARETKAAADAEKDAADRIHANNARKLHDLAEEVTAHKATRELQMRADLELAKLEEQFAVTAIARSGTTNEIEIANINARFTVLKLRLQEAGTFNGEVAAQFEANWQQALEGVGTDFDQAFHTRSIPALQELATNALHTYTDMVASGAFFREELDKQLAEYHELQDAARGYGKESVFAQQEAAAAAAQHTAALEAQTLAIEDAADAERRRRAGGSFDVTAANFGSTLAGFGLGNTTLAERLAHEGYSFQEIVGILRGALKGQPTGPRIPGFAGGVEHYAGGWAMVGERGPEPMYVPPGASIFPSGSGTGGGSYVDNRTLNFYGSTNELVEKVKRVLMREASTRRQFGAA